LLRDFIGLAIVTSCIVALCAATASAGRPRQFGIDQPQSTTSYTDAVQVDVDISYQQAAVNVNGLRIRENSTFLTFPSGQPGATRTLFDMPGALLLPGRNVLSTFVPATNANDPEAAVNDGFFVRHRVHFFQDQDRDGLADAVESGTAGLNDTDADNDGLLDGVESRPGFAGGIPGTSRLGAITFTAFPLTTVHPGRAFPIVARGLEAIDLPSEVRFGATPIGSFIHGGAPGGALDLLVVQAPNLSGSSTTLSLADPGGSTGAVSLGVDQDALPSIQNLVLVSSVFSQQFFYSNGSPIASRLQNQTMYLNMLQFGAATRVLIDASKVDPLYTPQITPDLETVYRTVGGVSTANTRVAGLLDSALLQNVDLLVLLVTAPVASYLPSETSAIRDWLRVPGRRLVVVADSCCGSSPGTAVVSANALLSAIGASSRFDTGFPTIVEQEYREIDWETAGIFPDPPFTNGVARLGYLYPGSVVPGSGSTVAAVVGICLNGETGVTVPGPDPLPILVACRTGESGNLPVVEANYVVSEIVATNAPMLQVTRIAPGTTLQGALSVPAHGFVQLPAANSLTVEARFDNLVPTSATIAGAAANINLGSKTITATVPFNAETQAAGIRVVANAPGTQLRDAAVARARRQRLRTRFVVFEASGVRAIPSAALANVRRQSGFELAAMCTSANGVSLVDGAGVPIPPLESPLRIDSDAVVSDGRGFNLLFVVDGALSTDVNNLVVFGNLPDGTPSALIPDAIQSGPGAIRVFVVGALRRRETDNGGAFVEYGIPQDTETGISQLGQAFVGGMAAEGLSGAVFDAVIVNAATVDLEAGALTTARPVVSSLTHELLHVAAGLLDSGNELPTPSVPVALPAATAPSSMNSFPYFRSLGIGSGTVARCGPGAAIPTGNAGTAELCRRMLLGYTCPGSPTGGGGLQLPIDFTE
jgi:hypothetical protein